MPSNPILSQVSPTLLEAYLPGFGQLSRFLESRFGLDINAIVSACLMVVALMGSYRYVFRVVQTFLQSWFVATITVTSTDRLYNQVMEYVSKRVLTDSSRYLAARSKTSSWEGRNPWEHRRGTTTNDYDQDYDINPAPLYMPAYGTHRFWHKGSFFVFKRSMQASQGENNPMGWGNTTNNEKEVLEISCIGRSPEPIKRLLRDCQTLALDQRRSMTTIHPSVGGSNWQRTLIRPSRPIDTVYMDEKVKSELLSDVRDFLSPAQPRYYARRGIPYRRGFLFWGEPGVGKTSLTLALAGEFGLELHVLSLMESGLTEQKLMMMFASLPPRCIILIEDVDTASISRGKLDREQNKKDENAGEKEDQDEASKPTTMRRKRYGDSTILVSDPEKISLSGLLNVIDGVASQEGRILVMTTNDPEALDEALIRPGRVDMQVHFGNLSKENARSLFVRMYSDDSAEQGVQGQPEANHKALEANGSAKAPEHRLEAIETYADEFCDRIPDLLLTPAEVQGFLLTRRKSPQKAVAEVGAWRDSVLAAKAQGKNILKTRDEIVASKSIAG